MTKYLVVIFHPDDYDPFAARDDRMGVAENIG